MPLLLDKDIKALYLHFYLIHVKLGFYLQQDLPILYTYFIDNFGLKQKMVQYIVAECR